MPAKPLILCVDDERNVVESMELNLRRHYQVKTALSGAHGLEILRAEKEVAVVLSDMRMPEMDGAAFLAAARETSPDTVRILLTGFADIEAAVRARELVGRARRRNRTAQADHGRARAAPEDAGRQR
jgi:response regulator RpfG family c-di-GMP phosphodiesterase